MENSKFIKTSKALMNWLHFFLFILPTCSLVIILPSCFFAFALQILLGFSRLSAWAES